MTALSASQDIFGRSGATAMASKERARLILGAGRGTSRRTRTTRPSPWIWMSKTSPGFAAGSTTRRLESTLEVAMVGLSHQDPPRRNAPSCSTGGNSGMSLTGAGEPLRVPVASVSGAFFSTLGMQAALGCPRHSLGSVRTELKGCHAFVT